MTTGNRLAAETSPYLLQHAGNPVDWWPWGPEAFAEAERRDVPVLVSVGYSACHWCHVMAHESFEDDDVASRLNKSYVAIKVDREERPDVDAVYMEAVQLVNGSGGWPMTVLAMPDGRPFWAGTYLPKQRLLGVLGQVTEMWEANRKAVETDAGRLADAVRCGEALPRPAKAPRPAGPAGGGDVLAGGPPGGDIASALGRAVSAIVARADPEWGGSMGAPKFPQATSLEALAQYAWRPGQARHPVDGGGQDEPAGPGDATPADATPADAMAALQRCLDAMSSGGIYDHLGGGFARYSTDRRWLVPHFEKMLYDNALLVRCYTQAWQLTGLPRYRQVVEETVGYLLAAPLRLAEGAWAAAEDADSEGEEGRFYVWDWAELVQVAGQQAAEWYGATPEGNWEGANILWRPNVAPVERPPHIEEARLALLARRGLRQRPGLDGKVLAEWDAMAISALAVAGRAMGRPDWVQAAATTAGVLLAQLRRPDGRWLRSWRPGSAGRHLACAADYAWLADAFTRLGEATGEASWTSVATQTADALLDLFWDEEEGAFFTYGSDSDPLVARLKDVFDGAVPSANAAAARALARLGELTGQRRYTEAAGRVVDAMTGAMANLPGAFAGIALAADFLAGPRRQVVVASPSTELVAPVWGRYLPTTVLAWGEPYPSPLWEGRQGPAAAGQAYVCEGYVCRLPVSTPAELSALLGGVP